MTEIGPIFSTSREIVYKRTKEYGIPFIFDQNVIKEIAEDFYSMLRLSSPS